MNYVDQIFERCDMEKIGGFLLYGSEIKKEAGDYHERLAAVDASLNQWLEAQFPQFASYNQHAEFINSVVAELETIYMQIGICVGVRMATECLNPFIKNK